MLYKTLLILDTKTKTVINSANESRYNVWKSELTPDTVSTLGSPIHICTVYYPILANSQEVYTSATTYNSVLIKGAVLIQGYSLYTSLCSWDHE